MPLGEPLSGGPSHYNPTSMAKTGWLLGNVSAVRNHSALLGYYVCDDCCGSAASVSGQSQLYNAIKLLDPWHIVVGSLQCTGAFWQWTDVSSEIAPQNTIAAAEIPVGVQPRLQLSLDVMMWEDCERSNKCNSRPISSALTLACCCLQTMTTTILRSAMPRPPVRFGVGCTGIQLSTVLEGTRALILARRSTRQYIQTARLRRGPHCGSRSCCMTHRCS